MTQTKRAGEGSVAVSMYYCIHRDLISINTSIKVDGIFNRAGIETVEMRYTISNCYSCEGSSGKVWRCKFILKGPVVLSIDSLLQMKNNTRTLSTC